jgi:hypothetical protein
LVAKLRWDYRSACFETAALKERGLLSMRIFLFATKT